MAFLVGAVVPALAALQTGDGLRTASIEFSHYATGTVYEARMRWGTLVALGFCISACAASVPTVAYYKAHRHELDQRLDDCIARGDTSQDCLNARQAYAEVNGLPAEDRKPVKP